MMEFVRFPKTPHLVWLGTSAPRDDKVLSSQEAMELLAHTVIIEEKLDGANIGISVDSEGSLRIQNRGSFLSWDSLHPQFRPLRQWLATRRHALIDALQSELILFGEWCYATHSVRYMNLPDWFVAFDVYDRSTQRFWSAERRDAFVLELGLTAVPRIAQGKFNVPGVVRLLGPSQFADEPAEGLYVRWDRNGYLEQRAKIVRAEFTQSIGPHWSRASIRPNQLGGADSTRDRPERQVGSQRK